MKKYLFLLMGLGASMSAFAQCTDLFISQYICGSGNSKAIQFYNPTGNIIVLSGNYRVAVWKNGATTRSYICNLIGSVLPNSTFLLCNGQTTIDSVNVTPSYTTPYCDTALQHLAQQLDTAHFPGVCYFSGWDALTLEKKNGASWSYVDIFGCIGEYPTSSAGSHVGWWNVAPFYNAPTGKSWTKYHTLVRKASVTQGVTTNPLPQTWNPAAEYDSLPKNTWPSAIHTMQACTGPCSSQFTLTPNAAQAGNYTVVNNASGKGTLKYDWNWGDGSPHDTIATPTHTYSTKALVNICLSIKDSSGCTSSTCDTLTVDRVAPKGNPGTLSVHTTVNVVLPHIATGLQAPLPAESLRIFPNPNPGQFSIVLESSPASTEFNMYTLLGEQAYHILLSGNQTKIDLGEMAKGIYIYKITSPGMGTSSGKIIVQ